MKSDKELQSRREFFKKAAEKALPVLGAIVVAGSPIIAQAAAKGPMGCEGCTGICTGCRGGCTGNCGGCTGCTGCTSCTGNCYGTCKGGCTGNDR